MLMRFFGRTRGNRSRARYGARAGLRLLAALFCLAACPGPAHAAFYVVNGGTVAIHNAAARLNVDGSVAVNKGALSAGPSNICLTGNWSLSGGSFIAGTSTVTFAGAAGTTSTLSGFTTFYNLACVTPGKFLDLPAGATQTVTGALTLAGVSGDLVGLRSTTPGVFAYLANTGSNSVSYANPKDINSGGGFAIATPSSLNGGNVVNWVFNNPQEPGAPVLSGVTISSNTIRWIWTSSGGQADDFYLFTASGSLVKSLSGSATYYLETNLSSATAYSRYLEASDSAGQAFSSTMTVATPAITSYLSGASTNTLVGTNGQTQLTIPWSLLGATMTWILSETLLQRPLMSNTTALIAAAGAPAGMQGSTESLTEFILAVDGVRSTQTLSSPVTVMVPYSDSAHPGFVDGTSPPVIVGTLQLYTIDETAGQWELVAGSWVDTVRKVVAGTVWHLSIFSAFGSASSVSADLSQARVYPVPYKPNGSNPDQGKPYSAGDDTSGIIFDQLPQSVTINIYNVSGQEVASFGSDNSAGKIQWDACNNSGHALATGLYLAVLKTPGQPSVTKKLLIIR